MLNLIATTAVLLALATQCVDSAVTDVVHIQGQAHVLMRRSTVSNRPSTPCNYYYEGRAVPVRDTDIVWICRKGRWLPYKLIHGNSEEYPASSCKEVRDFRTSLPPSEAYYINFTDPCTEESNITEVYCNMDEDGGGWTLVWKHSAMEVLPLTEDMRYFSDYYKACTDLEVGWCNIPNKDRLNPTEMMIAAHHNKTTVYAYKGIFNKNLDWHWSGGILLDPKKVVDLCTYNNGIQPAPYLGYDLEGLSFDKASPYHYTSRYDVYGGSLYGPTDCRWANCYLPPNISSTYRNTQMTVAIYVR